MEVDFMSGFSERFKKLRSEKGLTQEEMLADFNKKYHHNYRATAISYYENGKRIPEISALLNFADYFGVCVSYLLGESDVRNPDALLGSRAADDVRPRASEMLNAVLPNAAGLEKAGGEQEKELLHAFRSLSPTGKTAAINQVVALVDVFPAEKEARTSSGA